MTGRMVVGLFLIFAGITPGIRGLFLVGAGIIFILDEIDWAFLEKKKDTQYGSGDNSISQEDDGSD